jgi:hypothetical protein
MVTLNHTNLTTYNVPGLKEFFRSVSIFRYWKNGATNSRCCGIPRVFC